MEVAAILPLIGALISFIRDRTRDEGAEKALALLEQALSSGEVLVEDVFELRERIRDAMEDPTALIAELDERLASASARVRAVDLEDPENPVN